MATVAVLAGCAGGASAYWDVDAPLEGAGASAAASVDAGAVPTAAISGGTGIAVSWGASTLSTGVPVHGYVIRRYDSVTSVEATVGAGCSGVLAQQTCTETGVPAGTWRYTVTPRFATNWKGAESPQSGDVTRGPASLTLAKSIFGAPLPASTTGSATGFQAGEPITYSVGGVATTGSPGVADASGNVAITALAIPSSADGPKTVQVTGTTSGIIASAGILIDTTPPVLNTTISPTPNAAGWNNSHVDVTGNASDGDGSGLAYARGTGDGSDPKTSPTAQTWTGAPVPLDVSTVIKYYSVDLAGNESAVQTLNVKIDATPPVFTGEIADLTGGAYLGPGQAPDPATTWYRGIDAGSFVFRVIPIVDDGAPIVSVGASVLQGVTTGFTLVPTNTTTPEADGSFLTMPVSWVAGTTSTPIGTVAVSDEAGNTTTVPGTITNDSAPPSGSSVSATGLSGTGSLYSPSTTLHLELTPGTDNQSGLAPGAQLMRASAPLTSASGVANGVCGTYGAVTQIGANDPSSAVTDIVPSDDQCYRYEYTVPDHVGNVATSTTTDIKVQTAAPSTLTPSGVTITPVTGASAQLVSGSTLYYAPSQSGSFRVTALASDAWSGVSFVNFPAPAGFTGGGAVAPTESSTSFSSVYSWSNNGASGSPGAQTIGATDNAGFSPANASAFTLIADNGAPVNAITLGTATGARLTGTTLYYRPTAAGSFTLVDAMTDTGSGPASASFPALALSRWSHSAETVSTPAGGPFTSKAFAWSSSPSSPSTYTVTGTDKLGLQTTTVLTFARDQTAPTEGSITYANGIVTTTSVPLTLVPGIDAGAGLNPAASVVTRDTASLNTATGTCGTFPGTFATTVTLVGGADTSVTNAHCYKYRLRVSDYVGNQVTWSSSRIVKLDTTPHVTAISSFQSGGGAGDGQLQVGDRLVLTFNEPLAVASVPTTFSGATETRAFISDATLTIPGITNGALDTGSPFYLGSVFAQTATFGGTIALVNNGANTTLTITVTTLTGDATAASSGALDFTTATTITGTDGTAASGTFTTSSSFKLF